MSAVSKTSQLIPRAHVRYRVTAKGATLLDLQTGVIFELNRVGADVWETMAAGATIGDIVEVIRGKYSLTAEAAEADVNRVYREILAAGLGDPREGAAP